MMKKNASEKRQIGSLRSESILLRQMGQFQLIYGNAPLE